MASQKLARHIPKRASNERRKTRRKASWDRCQERKAARRRVQQAREEKNKQILRDSGQWDFFILNPTKTARRKILYGS